MHQLFQYYGRFQSVRGQVAGIPAWGRVVLFLFALPGIVLAALSILAFVVSLLALLVLTVPVYRLLRAISAPGPGREAWATAEPEPFVSRRRHVDVKIVE